MSALRITDLSKPQWDAALVAAKALTSGDPREAIDRATYRDAKARLTQLLPADADARDLIIQAVRWDSLNAIAGAFAGMPAATILKGAEPAQQAAR